ncbi:MAG: nucleotidyltransferase domain-containing protein [Candidatus Pacebacteria bacterium]|nr:nucleotidyltransferase domain-containing protein [Candidatus Paceibacterota bacterium]
MRSNQKISEVFKKIEQSNKALGLVLYGSKSDNTENKFSDYDILVVLPNENNKIDSSFTYIEGIPTDIFYCTKDELISIPTVIIANTKEDWLVSWIQNGKIIFENENVFKSIKNKVIKRVFTPENLNNCIYKINHNFIQDSRYFKMRGKKFREIYRIKFTHSINNILYSFFCIEKIPWRGEKWAVLLMEVKYKKFYKQYTSCLNEKSEEIQFSKYKKIVEDITLPFGGIWSDEIFADYVNKKSDENSILKSIIK